MLSWEELSRQLQQIANAIARFVRARKREEATIGLAAMLFWFGYSFPKWLTPEIKDWVNSWHGLLIIPGVFYVVGSSLFCYGLYRVWLLVHTPDLLPPRDRPSAIKGPIAFTPADGELFRRLGREDELGKLLGFIEDEQVHLVVVMGASGAGKTSLLRAGLTNILKNKGIDYHYWEAVPTSPGQRLLTAIQKSWQSERVCDANGTGNGASSTRLESLEDLVNRSSILGESRHVIVLDQFEQLQGSSANNPVFRLLRKIAREATPPHRVTWIVAFRREFRAEWEDFTLPEKRRGIYPAELSLRLFTAEQARDVISQLMAEARLSVHQKVLDSFVSSVTVDGEVSPVDIGIGLLVLAELHDRQAGKTLTLDDYQFAGGAEGLLTQYLSRCLDTFPDGDRQKILNAMLALCKPGANQRIAEGRTCAELAHESEIDTRRLKTQLERLTQRDMRLLEIVPTDENDVRYRLPHERLIRALHRLAGQLLADVDLTKLRFENAFTAWKNSNRSQRYLLKARELRSVERYKSRIPWGNDEADKRTFLRRSQRRRTLGRMIFAAATIAVVAAGLLANWQYQRYDARTYLSDNNYPPELYDWQHQSKVLKLNELMNVQRVPWLQSNSLEDFSIRVQSSTNSLEGLAAHLVKCRALKKLALDVSGSQVSDLTPLTKLSGLTQLSLNLNGSQVSDLTPLTKLSGLTHLSLSFFTKVSDLTPLTTLTGLTHLSLDLSYSNVGDLMPLTKLSGLTQLSLYLNDTKVTDLTPLTKLTGLTQLSLNLYGSQVSDLTPLTKLTGLTQLTLNVSASPVSDLTPLTKLTGLTQLSLSASKVSDLTPLTKLTGLTQLSLSDSEVSDLTPLTKLTGLTQLSFNVVSGVSDLTPLTTLTGLTQVTIHFSGVRDLTPLTKLSGLTQLNLSYSAVSDLAPLTKLTRLTQLTLERSDSKVSDLTPLTKLNGLTQLSLDLSETKVSDLTPLTKLNGLTQLSLNLNGSQVSDLTPLTKLTGLTQLSLDLSRSTVSDLTPLTKLDSCQTLVLSLNTSQRMLLRAIPQKVTHLEF